MYTFKKNCILFFAIEIQFVVNEESLTLRALN